MKRSSRGNNTIDAGGSDIGALRKRIDDIDDQILDLINRRVLVAQEIGRFKEQRGAPVVDRRRERKIIQKLLSRNKGPLKTNALHNIFTDIIAASRQIQRSTRGSGSTLTYAVIGDPVGHSLSPVMHNSAFSHVGVDGVYLAFRVIDIAPAIAGIRSLGIRGVSITIPHKITVMKYLDKIDELAGKIGAVNTVINRQGRLCGYNSDGLGAVRALSEKTPIRHRDVAIIGAGGAARAIGFAIKKEGGRVTILNRTKENGEKLARDLGAEFRPLAEADRLRYNILINTTPVGMTPHVDATPIKKEVLKSDMVVMDIVYNPLNTRLLQEAERIGCTIVDGVSMFVYQGAMQLELWTEKSAPVDIMKKVVLEELAGS